MKMHDYCAFLRGVNVNGRKMLMQDVCAAFCDAGMREVSSLLATGNIMFQSDKPKAELKEILQSALTARFLSPVYLFVKAADELSVVLNSCPFEKSNENHSYAFICEEGFEERLLEEFSKIMPLETEEAAVKNGVFYWSVPKGATLNAGFSKALSRRDLQSAFTSRNLNTIEKICDKLKIGLHK